MFEGHTDIDLHIQMISTIPSAQDLHLGQLDTYTHHDELWIWIPACQRGYEHFALFLNAMQSSPGIEHKVIDCELYGDSSKELKELLVNNFLP